jgi:RNA polymerase sigma-70 factor (ECF subfamily)
VPEATDEAIFERYRRGDHESLRTLVERHHDDLLRFLTRLVGDPAGADDVFQETFVQVHQSMDTFDSSRRFKPWLFTIAANKARDYLRRRARRRTLDLSAPVGSDDRGETFVDLLEADIPSPDADLSSEELGARVQAILAELPLALREILLLAYFQRLSYAHIADELGIPLGTVKSRLHAAVATFAKKWKAANPGPG